MDRLSEHIVKGPCPIESQEGGFFFVGEGQLSSTDFGRIDDTDAARYPTVAIMVAPPAVVPLVVDTSVYIVTWAFDSRIVLCQLG